MSVSVRMRGELPVESPHGTHPSGSIWRSPHSQENHWNFSGCQFCLFRGKLSLMMFAVPEKLGICSLLAASTALVYLKMKKGLKSELQLAVEVCGAGNDSSQICLNTSELFQITNSGCTTCPGWKQLHHFKFLLPMES